MNILLVSNTGSLLEAVTSLIFTGPKTEKQMVRVFKRNLKSKIVFVFIILV